MFVVTIQRGWVFCGRAITPEGKVIFWIPVAYLIVKVRIPRWPEIKFVCATNCLSQYVFVTVVFVIDGLGAVP
jgi:hypothetical protein